jgi:hypothetical protein
VFRDPVFAVTADSRATVESAARELLRVLAELPVPPTLRVAEVDGRVTCLIQVWDNSIRLWSQPVPPNHDLGSLVGAELEPLPVP